jgi:hypothetical protein
MLTELGAFVLPAVPLLVLLAFLLLGRFPGEQAIARLSRRLSTAAPRPGRRAANRRRLGGRVPAAPRGGLLIGCGLARRPPPAFV